MTGLSDHICVEGGPAQYIAIERIHFVTELLCQSPPFE